MTWAIANAMTPCTTTGKTTKKTKISPSEAATELRATTMTARNANTAPGKRARHPCRPLCAERHPSPAATAGGCVQGQVRRRRRHDGAIRPPGRARDRARRDGAGVGRAHARVRACGRGHAGARAGGPDELDRAGDAPPRAAARHLALPSVAAD